ncbi:MAG: twin-arginine translocase TatA/TatE family subunit [Blastocatellia bacterium]
MGPIGMPELLIIALIIIILFGARRIPELAKGLGEGIRHFKTGVRGDDPREIDERRYRDDDRRYRDDDRKYRDEPERREEPRTSA